MHQLPTKNRIGTPTYNANLTGARRRCARPVARLVGRVSFALFGNNSANLYDVSA